MPYANKADQLAAQRRWYANNKGKQKHWNRSWRAATLDWFRGYKQTLACTRCGEDEAACLDFHHIKDKDNDVAKMAKDGASKEAILKEVTKCIVLCANCHRKLHAGVV